MSFFWRAIGMGGNAIPNFNFTIGDVVTTYATKTLTWSLREGTRTDDNTRVTIFMLAIEKDDEGSKELARNIVKRAKTLLLPGILRCYDATEHNGTVYIATEECLPLQNILDDDAQCESYYEDKEKYKECVAHGLHQVCHALNMMHQNGLIHGNVGVESVYCLRSGEWRLFGLELVSQLQESHSIYHKYHHWLPEYRRPPETANDSSGGGGGFGIHTGVISPAIDSWGLGCLIYAAFLKNLTATLATSHVQEVRAFRSMPRSLQNGYVGVTGANPKLRMSVEKFLQDSDFIGSSEYVKALQALEELALKDAADRDNFYRKLSSVLDLFPIRACKFTILAKLSVAVQYGGGSATALEPILKIGARLTDPVVFGELVAPIVITLFSSQDHLVRCRLLTTASQYAKLLPSALVNEKIWSHYVTGFANKNADMRELSVRALVHFAPHLSEKNVKEDVLRCISGLQQDREGPIRTNATICLCMIANYIPESVRCKTLVHGFGRMLKDPFGPSRVAAVRSILNSVQHILPTSMAELLLPAVAPMCVDPLHEVRDVALKAIDAMVERLRSHHGEMPADPEPASPAAPLASPAGTNSVARPMQHTASRENVSSNTATPVSNSVAKFADPVTAVASPAAVSRPSSHVTKISAPTAADDGWGAIDDDEDFAPAKPKFGLGSSTGSSISTSLAAKPAATTPSAKAKEEADEPHAPPMVILSSSAAGGTGALKLKKKGFGAAKAE